MTGNMRGWLGLRWPAAVNHSNSSDTLNCYNNNKISENNQVSLLDKTVSSVIITTDKALMRPVAYQKRAERGKKVEVPCGDGSEDQLGASLNRER